MSTSKRKDSSFETCQYFDLVVELFRYYAFKEDSTFVSQFRPVPTIEPPEEQSKK
jgi:hypothetical protein